MKMNKNILALMPVFIFMIIMLMPQASNICFSILQRIA